VAAECRHQRNVCDMIELSGQVKESCAVEATVPQRRQLELDTLGHPKPV